MDFISLAFLGYVALVAGLYWLCPKSWRAAFLLIGSYVFYCSWNAELALLLFGVTVAAYIAGRAMEASKIDSRQRAILLTTVAILVLILTIYKSGHFLQAMLGYNLLLPLGLSYYTFKLIGYLVDVYWGTMPAEKAFIPFAAYVAFFPQIMAGPIQRAQSFLPQMQRAARPSFSLVIYGLQRILLGYMKKFLVADHLSLLVNFIYGRMHQPGTPLLWACYAYPIQMYADFSGLTDIANGVACLLGFDAPENFDAPFSATSISDYWRRWHMSFTSWLTDYVYMPLRMSSRSLGRFGLVLSLTVMMVFIGLWHEFRWSFVVFGLIHAFYLSVDALTSKSRRKFYEAHPGIDKAARWICPILVFQLVAVGLVFFRVPRLPDSFFVLSHVGQGLLQPSPEFQDFWRSSGRSVLVGMVAYVLVEALDVLRRRDKDGTLVVRLPRWVRWATYSCTATAVLMIILLLLVNGSVHNPFVYAVF